MAESSENLYISNMDPASSEIRSYSLFGESAHLPDVMHCETIAARSVLHGWEFSPHRHARLHQVLLIESGKGTVRIDDNVVQLRSGSTVNVPPGHVHAFRFRQRTEGWVVTIADELLDEILVRVGDVRRGLSRSGVLAADPSVRQLMRQIWHEFTGRSKARALMLRGLCATLLAWVARNIDDGEIPQQSARNTALLQQLETLIEEHYSEQWSVARYARALSISPTHLTRVCRTTTGVSALSLIEGRAMREARRQLAYTNQSVKTIAFELGYSDPAYFTRAFTRDAGLSPRAFRAQVSGKTS
jgi:AraC family transcriptional activator of pobA